MVTHRAHRQLAAIMSVDVVGFSRLMGVDEDGTLATLKRLQKTIVSPQVSRHQGRIAKLMGDGAIIIFSSVVDAVAAGIAIQQAMPTFNDGTSPEKTVAMRIGINLGDVILEGSDIYGDGVNVAARIQAVCIPGGVALSATAHEHVNGKVDAEFADVGERVLKNITRKVRIFRWPDTIHDIAEAENLSESYTARYLRLAYLSPEVLETLILQRRPAAVRVVDLVKIATRPWVEQVATVFGDG